MVTANPFAAALYRVILHIRDKRLRSPEIILSFLSEPVRCCRDGKSQIRICILTAPFTAGDDVDASATLLCTRVLHARVASFFTLMDSQVANGRGQSGWRNGSHEPATSLDL